GTVSTVGGGYRDTATAFAAVVAGGELNHATNIHSGVGAGYFNQATGNAAYIGGGSSNLASGAGSVIGGGGFDGFGTFGDTASGAMSTIGGGMKNIASGYSSFVGGGGGTQNLGAPLGNIASGIISTVVAGTGNLASGNFSTVGGGGRNSGSGTSSTVGGGFSNTAAGWRSVIPGGARLTIGDQSFGFNGENTAALVTDPPTLITDVSAFPFIAYFGNVDLWIGNSTSTAKQLRFYSPNASLTYAGATYSAFVAQAQAASITYTLPAAAPSVTASGTALGAGYMTTTNTGAMSWQQSIVTTGAVTFANTAAQSSSDQNIAVTGAASGDVVALGVPNGAVLANSSYSAWVSANDVVTIRFNNYSAAAQNPGGPFTFKVVVTK
ncbi:MAG TPA: hypothetical protein VET48_11655, partial [Steroidobacteraceae bacterium]|nr:hypothetical protein [Steroidobacteraceae bacterium]